MKSTVLVGSDQLWGRAILSLCICILARYEITLSLSANPSTNRTLALRLSLRQKTKNGTHTIAARRDFAHKKTRQTHDQNAIRTHTPTRRAAQWLATVTGL